MKKMLLVLSLVALTMASGTAVWAQDFQKGVAAVEAGDYATALEEWKPLAEQGVAAAQYNLGISHSKGQGVPQDYTEAVKWWRLAAEQGHAGAQAALGLSYYGGKGVLQNGTKAVKWFRLSAEQGNATAQTALGLAYEYGDGVLQSMVMAHMWYNIASANGHSRAGEYRDKLADEMTKADFSKAQEMALECMESDYESCGE